MTRRNRDTYDDMYAGRNSRLDTEESWKSKLSRFLRYLSTRNIECWGFFAAGFLIATIF